MTLHRFEEEITIEKERYKFFSYKDLKMLSSICEHNRITCRIIEVVINSCFIDRWLFVKKDQYHEIEKVYKELCEQI